jgi:hypothetical protein
MKTSNRIRRFIPAALLAVLVAQLVGQRPANAAVYGGVYFGQLQQGTISVTQDGIEYLFRDHVAPLVASQPAGEAGSALLAADDTVGTMLALRTATGWATVGLPALGVGGVVAGVGGAVIAAVTAHYIEADKSKPHLTGPALRFVNDGSTYGALDMQIAGTYSVDAFMTDHQAVDSTYSDPNFNWGSSSGGCSSIGYDGLKCSWQYDIDHGNALLKQVGLLYHGDASAVPWSDAGHHHVSGGGVVGPWDDGVSRPVQLDGTPWTILQGGGMNTWCGGGCYPNSGWDVWNTTVSQTMTPVPITKEGVTPLVNTADADAKRRIRALGDPAPGYPAPVPGTVPTAYSGPGAPPMLYMGPDGTWHFSPAGTGLPPDDDGVATPQTPTYDPATGDTAAPGATPTPGPTATPTVGPSPSPSPSSSPSARPSPAVDGGGNTYYPLGTPDNFITHFWNKLKVCFPLDWILDFGSVTFGPEPHLHYTTFKGVTFNGQSMEQDFDLDFIKPWAAWAVRIISLGIVVAAIYI